MQILYKKINIICIVINAANNKKNNNNKRTRKTSNLDESDCEIKVKKREDHKTN